MCNLSDVKNRDIKINFLNSFFIKEYSLCFDRVSSTYDLTNNIIKLYTTIFFSVISVFGFLLNTTYSSVFSNNKILPLSLLLGLTIYGIATLFMHISTWSARNYYRKKRSHLQMIILGLYEEGTLYDALINYLCIPRYVKSGILHSLSLYLWYFIYLVICNWISVILFSSILFGLDDNKFLITILVFLPGEWIIAEIYIILKKHSHKKKCKIKKEKIIKCYKNNFFKLLTEEYYDI